MDLPPPPPSGSGGFLSNRRIKLTAVFPMIIGTRHQRNISKSDSSSLEKSGRPPRKPSLPKSSRQPPVTERVSPTAADTARNRIRRGSSLTDLNRSDSLADSNGSFGDLMNLKRFYDDSSIGSAENLVARAVPLSTVFCSRHHYGSGGIGSEESILAIETGAVTAPSTPSAYHHRTRFDLQPRRYALAEHHKADQSHYTTAGIGIRAKQQSRADMTSQQRIERMSRIMKQNHHRVEPSRFRHTLTLCIAGGINCTARRRLNLLNCSASARTSNTLCQPNPSTLLLYDRP
ncbi:uncharacterized protein LOC126901416 [Daktulosphaira vitifoliae]|uniref:uncharacterized protein LOC126901416 n=1 Tax=Daktulosphaira vitifoliae TaxID=58002 RepID=UPI0021AA3D89|nr:uncharacterized protein LOC126901416 [Daktulosphaira vitifoliae]